MVPSLQQLKHDWGGRGGGGEGGRGGGREEYMYICMYMYSVYARTSGDESAHTFPSLLTARA